MVLIDVFVFFQCKSRSLHSMVLIDVFVFSSLNPGQSLHSVVLIDVFVFFQCKSRSIIAFCGSN